MADSADPRAGRADPPANRRRGSGTDDDGSAGSGAGSDGSAGSGRSPRERDRVTVRRALLAGGAAWALVGGPLIVGLAPAGGDASAAGMLLGLVVGGIVASGWLLLAAAIDLRTDQPIGRRRVAWTVGVTALAVIAPVMVAGVGG